jgi:hypothetical protein
VLGVIMTVHPFPTPLSKPHPCRLPSRLADLPPNVSLIPLRPPPRPVVYMAPSGRRLPTLERHQRPGLYTRRTSEQKACATELDSAADLMAEAIAAQDATALEAALDAWTSAACKAMETPPTGTLREQLQQLRSFLRLFAVIADLPSPVDRWCSKRHGPAEALARIDRTLFGMVMRETKREEKGRKAKRRAR